MKQVILFLLMFTLTNALLANGKPTPTKIVEGTVIDKANGELLTGVRVELQGMPIAAMTDENGHFTLEIPLDANPTLIFEFVSFEKVAVNVGSENLGIEVKMSELP